MQVGLTVILLILAIEEIVIFIATIINFFKERVIYSACK